MFKVGDFVEVYQGLDVDKFGASPDDFNLISSCGTIIDVANKTALVKILGIDHVIWIHNLRLVTQEKTTEEPKLFNKIDNLIPEGVKFLNKELKRGGTKHDSGKPKIKFLSREFVEGVAAAQTFGSAKYGDWNFRNSLETTALYDALMRHMIAWMSGENNDPESGLSHLSHAGANLNMLMWMLANKPEMDDRPQKDKNEETKD